MLLIRERSEILGDLSQGLGIIGTIAKEEVEVRIIDNNSHYVDHSVNRLVAKIAEFGPDVVGFHVHHNNLLRTARLVASIKTRFPGICLIAGGLHAFHEPVEVLDAGGVHIVAVEEADLTILPLLRALKAESVRASNKAFQISRKLSEKLSSIPGLIYREGPEAELKNTGRPEFIKNLDDLPFIDYELFNLEDYIFNKSDGHYVTNTLLTQRGCPFSCSFCQGGESGAFRLARENSPEYKIEYLRYLMDRYGHHYFVFYDANFTLSAKRTKAFCDLMVASGLNEKVGFWCETNASLKLDDALADAMRRAGCRDVALGIERLTENSLEQINKKLRYEVVLDRIRSLNKVGIRVTANALIGFPFDNPETICREEKLFGDLLSEVESIMVSVVIPLPGTEIYMATDNKKWYLDWGMVEWEPPFYHRAYNYNGPAWCANFFNLDRDTMAAVRGMRERMHALSIFRLDSRIVTFLFFFVQIFAKLSFHLHRLSPSVERVIFFPVTYVYTSLWKFMVSKFYVSR